MLNFHQFLFSFSPWMAFHQFVFSIFLNRVKRLWDFTALFNTLIFYPVISDFVIVFTQRNMADKQASRSGRNPNSGVHVSAQVKVENEERRVVSFLRAPQFFPLSFLTHQGNLKEKLRVSKSGSLKHFFVYSHLTFFQNKRCSDKKVVCV